MISLMHRIAATWLVLSATVVLVAGCGDGTSVSASTSAGPVTEAQLVAYAHAVNLRPADLPEAVARGPAETMKHRRSESPLLRCTGLTSAQNVLAIASRSLNGPGGEVIQSAVLAMPSTAVATAYVAAFSTSRGRKCLERTVSGTQAKVISAISLAVPVGPGSVGVRTRVRFGRPGFAQLYIDEFFFVAGPTVVSLIASYGEKPTAPATEDRLLSLLYSRAEAHRL